jgi:hypothetical protein
MGWAQISVYKYARALIMYIIEHIIFLQFVIVNGKGKVLMLLQAKRMISLIISIPISLVFNSDWISPVSTSNTDEPFKAELGGSFKMGISAPARLVAS